MTQQHSNTLASFRLKYYEQTARYTNLSEKLPRYGAYMVRQGGRVSAVRSATRYRTDGKGIEFR
jgi:hypothetical protein